MVTRSGYFEGREADEAFAKHLATKSLPAAILTKIRRYGVADSLVRAMRGLRRKIVFHLFFLGHLVRLLATPYWGQHRVLGIWDFKALPFSIGDILMFLGNLAAVRMLHGASGVDICVIYDRGDPQGNRKAPHLSSQNCDDYMLDMLPLFSVCPDIGNIHQFSSRAEANRFLKGSMHRYVMYPKLHDHLTESYNHIGGGNMKPLHEAFKKVGAIPHLRVGMREAGFAYQFFRDNLPSGTVPVVVLLRNTKNKSVRNANFEAWKEFFECARTEFPSVTFVVIGYKHEASVLLGAHANLIYAKDYGTSAVEDLALMRCSLVYLAGSDSGPIVMAMLSDLPYVVMNVFERSLNLIFGAGKDGRLSFAKGNQRLIGASVTVTPQLISEQFGEVFRSLDVDAWEKTAAAYAKPKIANPTTEILSSGNRA